MLLGEALRHGQAEAGSILLFLGGEEWGENSFRDRRRDAGTLIDDGQDEPFAARTGSGFGANDNADIAAVGESGFAGVFGQFNDGGSDPGRISMDGGEVFRNIEVDFGSRAAKLFQAWPEHSQKLPYIDGSKHGGGGPHQSLGPIHELGRLSRSLFDLRKTFQSLRVERFVLDEHGEVSMEQRKDVVHPVRETAHELILKVVMSDLH